MRTASRIRFTPSPARNASSNADRSDCSRAIGSISFDAYLPVHTENHADGPTHRWTLPATSNPTTRRDAHGNDLGLVPRHRSFPPTLPLTSRPAPERT